MSQLSEFFGHIFHDEDSERVGPESLLEGFKGDIAYRGVSPYLR